jgi:Uma2 family endonuclease
MSSLETDFDLDRQDHLPNGRLRPSLRMTEEEFVDWYDEDVKAEWVDGEVILMAPASGEHVDLGGWLYMLLRLFVERRDLGKIRGPEFMIRLAKRPSRRVPDILFVAKDRLHLLKPNHLEGAPDLCLEIVSPDSQSRDRRDKYQEYEKAGVREYWIIDPLSRTLEAYELVPGQGYRSVVADADERLPSTALPGFYLRAIWLFGSQAMPDVLNVLRELGVSP